MLRCGETKTEKGNMKRAGLGRADIASFHRNLHYEDGV